MKETNTARPGRAFLFSHPAHFIALGLGSGLSPKAPGTIGTLAALPLYAVLAYLLSPLAIALLCVPLFALGAWSAQRTCHDYGVHDHGSIVIDEIVAMFLVLICTPNNWLGWLSAFVWFRIFDIVKPWPISWLDKHVHGGIGVMLDDLLAALYAITMLWLMQHLELTL